MRNQRLITYLIIGMAPLLVVPLHLVQGQNYCVYNVQVRSDGSALWVITQFSSTSTSVETWEGFQEKIFDLIDSASSVTHRAMDIDENSLQINSTLSSESKTTEYSFIWQNFSVIQGDELSFGDVFQVPDFFNQLFGDAALHLSYPEDFMIKSVNPPPYERQDLAHTMEWARTQDLVSGAAQIILAPNTRMSIGDNPSQNDLIIVAVLAAGISALLLSLYAFKRRQRSGKTDQLIISESSPIETDEDKILKLLKASGGAMRQSDITEKCGFSKAKTSQLLTALESSGNLTRYKKGRDKIVTIKERVTGEQ